MATGIFSADGVPKAFAELEAHGKLISDCIACWRSLSDHFAGVEKDIAARSAALDSKIHALEDDTNFSLAALESRELALPDRESAAAATVTDLRAAALAEIEASHPVDPPEDISGLLKWYCRRMDSSGLWSFLFSRRKEPIPLRSEIPGALAVAVDPARLAIDVAEEFVEFHPDGNVMQGSVADRCRMLGLLLRALYGSLDRWSVPEVASKIGERAVVVAEKWRKKAEGEDGKLGAAESQVLLQMIVAFGVHSLFDKEYLKNLVIEHASRKEMAKIVSLLEFGDALEDIIVQLEKSGKVIEAIYIAHECGLGDKISAIPLLKSFIQSIKKNNSSTSRNGKDEPTNSELNSLRSAIRCIETCKLESKFSMDWLRKRIEVLEKARANRKKSVTVGKSRSNRILSGGGLSPQPYSSKAIRGMNAPFPSLHRNLPAQHSGVSRHPYNYPGPSAYDTPFAYSQSPGSIAPKYYMPEELGGGPSGAAGAYGGAPVSMPVYGGAYHYGAAHGTSTQLPPSYPR